MLGLGIPVFEPWLWSLMFVMIRIGAAFIAAPVFGATAVPLQVRILLAGAIGVLVLRATPIEPPAEVMALTTLLMIVQEVLVGLALGFIIQIAFAAPLIAAEAIAGSMGLSFASAVDPQNGTSTTALGQFMSIIMTLLFLSLNGHLILADMVVRSYESLPPGAAWLAPAQLQAIAMFGSFIFMAGLLLALPVGFVLLCLNLIVGMLSRSAPSLNLFAIGLPSSLLVGLVALAIAFPAMGDLMVNIVTEALATSERLVMGR